MGAEFIEKIHTTIAREKSLNNWSCIRPSSCDIFKGGWIISNVGDYSKCPHCHMEYYSWQSDDNPLIIHKYLSPYCLFVLSQNPFISNPIPIRKVEEVFTNEEILNAESKPYAGLVRPKYESMFAVWERKNSFDRFPGGCPFNVDELARDGLYYTNRGRVVKCFYCKSRVYVFNSISSHNSHLMHLHSLSQCRYMEQLKDCDLQNSKRQGKDQTQMVKL